MYCIYLVIITSYNKLYLITISIFYILFLFLSNNWLLDWSNNLNYYSTLCFFSFYPSSGYSGLTHLKDFLNLIPLHDYLLNLYLAIFHPPRVVFPIKWSWIFCLPWISILIPIACKTIYIISSGERKHWIGERMSASSSFLNDGSRESLKRSPLYIKQRMGNVLFSYSY